jgi:tetratricopeptide (TPR) repeat protein
MKLKLLVFVFFSVLLSNVYPEEIRKIGDSTVIYEEMTAPSQNAEAANAYDIGTGYLRQNNFAEAEKYLLKAVELDPGFVDAMDHFGFAYRNQKKYDEAERIYLRSIETVPNNIVPYINLAVVYKNQGRLEEARQIYLKANRINEDNPEPYYGIGTLYQMAGQYENSIAFIDIAIQIYYQNNSSLIYDACYIQGDNYYHLKNSEEAVKYYNLALLGYPEDAYLLEKINEIENRTRSTM